MPWPLPCAISHALRLELPWVQKAPFLLSLITNKRWKLRPSPIFSQRSLPEEKHSFLDSPSLRGRGFLNLEKMVGPFFALVISVPNHGTLLRVLKSFREHKQIQELKPGGYNQFCKPSEKINRIVHWLTPDKYVWLTSTVKESPLSLSDCSAVQGRAMGIGTFAVSGTNSCWTDYLEAVLLDRFSPILNSMLQPGKHTEGRRLASFPGCWVWCFFFTFT